MELCFVSRDRNNRRWWNGIVFQITISDDYIPLWKKAGIYNLLYEREVAIYGTIASELTWALTDMSIDYLDYRKVVKLAPVNEGLGPLMDELLREQCLRQAIVILAMLIQNAIIYPQTYLRRELKEATFDG